MNATVVGASGYSGRELVSLLIQAPENQSGGRSHPEAYSGQNR